MGVAAHHGSFFSSSLRYARRKREVARPCNLARLKALSCQQLRDLRVDTEEVLSQDCAEAWGYLFTKLRSVTRFASLTVGRTDHSFEWPSEAGPRSSTLRSALRGSRTTTAPPLTPPVKDSDPCPDAIAEIGFVVCAKEGDRGHLSAARIDHGGQQHGYAIQLDFNNP